MSVKTQRGERKGLSDRQRFNAAYAAHSKAQEFDTEAFLMNPFVPSRVKSALRQAERLKKYHKEKRRL